MRIWKFLKRLLGFEVRRGYFVVQRKAWEGRTPGDWVGVLLGEVVVESVREEMGVVRVTCRHPSFGLVPSKGPAPQYLPHISFKKGPDGEEQKVSFSRL